MKKFFLVPIEPLPERYSTQWISWFGKEFNRHNIDHEFIFGKELTSKIEVGSFLDVYGTNYYKAHQLTLIIEKIRNKEVKDGDVIFFFDLWFPGLEMLQYIRQGAEIDFKICGVFHAGTYDEGDFLFHKGMASWGEMLENSWLNFIDVIFVATDFHKQLILEKRKVVSDKIKVTGLPLYFSDYSEFNLEKENIVVFPHRLDIEKQPYLFDEVKDRLRNKYPNWHFIKSKEYISRYSEDKQKEEYYRLLSKSKISVSFALQETWGIAMQESLFYGCKILVPKRLSYLEMYLPAFKFSTMEEFYSKLIKLMDGLEEDSFQEAMRLNSFRLKQSGVNAISQMILNMENGL